MCLVSLVEIKFAINDIELKILFKKLEFYIRLNQADTKLLYLIYYKLDIFPCFIVNQN